MYDNKKDYTRNILIAIAVGVLLIIFVVRPLWFGYNVQKEMEKTNYTFEDYGRTVGELDQQLTTTITTLGECKEESVQRSLDLDTCLDDFAQCRSALQDVNSTYKDYQRECEKYMEDLGDDLGEKEDELEDLQEEFDEFVRNAAENICCKAKVDDVDINFYEIRRNRVVCLDTGENRISCQFD